MAQAAWPATRAIRWSTTLALAANFASGGAVGRNHWVDQAGMNDRPTLPHLCVIRRYSSRARVRAEPPRLQSSASGGRRLSGQIHGSRRAVPGSGACRARRRNSCASSSRAVRSAGTGGGRPDMNDQRPRSVIRRSAGSNRGGQFWWTAVRDPALHPPGLFHYKHPRAPTACGGRSAVRARMPFGKVAGKIPHRGAKRKTRGVFKAGLGCNTRLFPGICRICPGSWQAWGGGAKRSNGFQGGFGGSAVDQGARNPGRASRRVSAAPGGNIEPEPDSGVFGARGQVGPGHSTRPQRLVKPDKKPKLLNFPAGRSGVIKDRRARCRTSPQA